MYEEIAEPNRIHGTVTMSLSGAGIDKDFSKAFHGVVSHRVTFFYLRKYTARFSAFFWGGEWYGAVRCGFHFFNITGVV